MIDKLWDSTVTSAQIFSLGDAIVKDPSPRPTVRVAIAGSLTTGFLARAVACAIAREGDAPAIYEAPHGAYVQEILDDNSGLYRFGPDVIVLAIEWRELVAALPFGASEEIARASIERTIGHWASLWNALRGRGVHILQHIPSPPPERMRGVADRFDRSGLDARLSEIHGLLFRAGRGVVEWIDVDTLASRIGTDRWQPARMAYNGAMPFDPIHLPAYMRLFGGVWRAANGRGKKLLALDLDDTLWGGVVGEDGVDGLELGPGSARGEAYAHFQRYVAAMRNRGVILAACSKNDERIARSGFDHRYSCLKASDFAALACSWDDKALGLRRIAASVGIGLESMVFADDNAAECAFVRQELPMVATVSLGNDPSTFIARIEMEHWFDANDYTQADIGRAESYSANAVIEGMRESATDLGAFLRGLEMRGRLFAPSGADLPRLAQLEKRTNQFNLSGRRYDEQALKLFQKRDDVLMMACTLGDRLVDHGLVASAIGIVDGDDMILDSWVMSCRVFSRTLENFMIAGFVSRAREYRVKRVRAAYRPSERNSLVPQILMRLGFQEFSSDDWRLDIGGFIPPETFVENVG